MSTGARPDVVVLDLDGVLRRWDPAIMGRAEARAGLPEGALVAAALDDHELLRDAVTGVLSDGEWRAEITRRLARRFGAAAEDAVAAWSHPAGEVDHDVLTLVREVRVAVPVALFSNATTRLPRDLDTLGLGTEVDVVISSAVLGLAKPDPAAFVEAARRCGRAPGDCLFVDDSAANVAGARSVGMDAHEFTSPPALRALLVASGLIEDRPPGTRRGTELPAG
ncbi:HAD-IA family hydrolase [Nocardioides sp. GXQ0305]|uniref:HAD-IA family hydrolase n=1 Tax=Nocardioides sp. GXQ0305 TaxID=3423912 RepID=UPI003D7C80B3